VDQEIQQPLAGDRLNETKAKAAVKRGTGFAASEDLPGWVFIGEQGLRAGWAAAICYGLFRLFSVLVGSVFFATHLVGESADFSATGVIFGELISFLAMIGAVLLMAVIEGRNPLEYNLMGPRRVRHFFFGMGSGLVALSVLMGGLAAGGWLHFGAVALSGFAILKLGVLWGIAFLIVACVEEGLSRCYLQFTLTHGINFWWALGTIGVVCGDLLLRGKGNGIWGVYGLALLGVAPCALLHFRKAEGAGFWQAAWVTSTLFGFIHTGNNGENWIGIFAAAAIGFVFCVSVRFTGSAWWAIGFHAAWDWGETYFYGSADSGNVATGHYLSTSPAGSAFWSGGTDGPEGSVLIIPLLILVTAAIVAVYGRREAAEPAALKRVTG